MILLPLLCFKAQWWQDLPGLGEWGGPPPCHLHAEGGQHEGGLQSFLHRAHKGWCISKMQCWWCNYKWLSMVSCLPCRLNLSSKRRAMSSCGMSTWATYSPVPLTWGQGCVVVSMLSFPTWAKMRSLARSSRSWGFRNVEQVQDTSTVHNLQLGVHSLQK